MMQTLAIIGILGGILCAFSDCLLDIKGSNNIKLGKYKYIESTWDTMNPKRFYLSGILVMFAVPMYSCSFISLMMYLNKTHQTLSIVLTAIFLTGAMGGFMIHTLLCLVPVIYKTVNKTSFELAEELLNKMFKHIMIPFVTLYSAAVIVPSIVVIVLITTNILPLPLWCVLINPVAFQTIGILLKCTKCKLFADVPSIFAASLGIGMYGVLTLILL